MAKKVKSVAFNLADPGEFKLYRHSQQYRNFSKYVKRLIQRDLEGGKQVRLTEEEIKLLQVYQEGEDS